jgi:hypothetical protein
VFLRLEVGVVVSIEKVVAGVWMVGGC